MHLHILLMNHSDSFVMDKNHGGSNLTTANFSNVRICLILVGVEPTSHRGFRMSPLILIERNDLTTRP